MWSQLKSHAAVVERERHREHSLHRIKLLRIRLKGGSPLPRVQQLSPLNTRKVRLAHEKLEEIRWENQVLLKKMIDIGRKPTSLGSFAERKVPTDFSLNRRNRSNAFEQINKDNKLLLKRLQRTQSSYSVKHWEAESEYYSHLREKLSQNSGRVPRSANYTSASFDRMMSVSSFRQSPQHSTRPSHKRSKTAGLKLLRGKLRRKG